MSISFRFLPEVPDDILGAGRWYESQRVGLGQEFIVQLCDALSRIAKSPAIYAAGKRGVRSVRLRKFPYIVHYRLTNEVVILAVMHGSRHPSAWRGRL